MGRVRACSAGRYPRFTPAPIRQPRPSVAQRSGKRRQPPTTSAGDAFWQPAARLAQVPTSHPPPPGGGRRPGRAFDSHSSRDCQHAEEVVLFAAPPGYVPRCSTAVGSAPRIRSDLLRSVKHVGGGRRLEERGAARRGPRRPTIQQHHCAPHRVLAHTHRLAPYRARGAAPISPTSVNWPYPPSGKGGAD